MATSKINTAVKVKRAFRPGDALYVNVGPEHISDSDPCNKDNCMLTRAFADHLVKTYGGKVSDYKVKSTNHGTAFELNGRRYICVFDTKTAKRIYTYDQTFRDTRSKRKARATQSKFQTRLMVEASTVATKFPMSEERKEYLRNLPPRKKSEVSYVPKNTGSRRELSL